MFRLSWEETYSLKTDFPPLRSFYHIASLPVTESAAEGWCVLMSGNKESSQVCKKRYQSAQILWRYDWCFPWPLRACVSIHPKGKYSAFLAIQECMYDTEREWVMWPALLENEKINGSSNSISPTLLDESSNRKCLFSELIFQYFEE